MADNRENLVARGVCFTDREASVNCNSAGCKGNLKQWGIQGDRTAKKTATFNDLCPLMPCVPSVRVLEKTNPDEVASGNTSGVGPHVGCCGVRVRKTRLLQPI